MSVITSHLQSLHELFPVGFFGIWMFLHPSDLAVDCSYHHSKMVKFALRHAKPTLFTSFVLFGHNHQYTVVRFLYIKYEGTTMVMMNGSLGVTKRIKIPNIIIYSVTKGIIIPRLYKLVLLRYPTTRQSEITVSTSRKPGKVPEAGWFIISGHVEPPSRRSRQADHRISKRTCSTTGHHISRLLCP